MKLRKITSVGSLTNEQLAGRLRAVPNRYATAKRLAGIPHGRALLSSLYTQTNVVVPAEFADKFPKTYAAIR